MFPRINLAIFRNVGRVSLICLSVLGLVGFFLKGFSTAPGVAI